MAGLRPCWYDLTMARKPSKDEVRSRTDYETTLQQRQGEEKELRAALAIHRKRKLTEVEALAAMSGHGELPAWVPDMLWLLERGDYLTLSDLAAMAGVNRKTLMQWRRKHPPLEAACRDYLAATFEEEMELPHRGIRPGILTMAAERIIPTFSKDQDGMISEEDAALLVRAILDSLRTRIAATELNETVRTAVLHGIASDIRHEFAKRKSD